MVLDGLHKIWSPKTYPCSLCGITYGAFSERKIWKNFRRDLNVEMEFLYKDAFMNTYASKFGYAFTFPIILISNGMDLEVFMDTTELDALSSIEELMIGIKGRMQY